MKKISKLISSIFLSAVIIAGFTFSLSSSQTKNAFAANKNQQIQDYQQLLQLQSYIQSQLNNPSLSSADRQQLFQQQANIQAQLNASPLSNNQKLQLQQIQQTQINSNYNYSNNQLANQLLLANLLNSNNNYGGNGSFQNIQHHAFHQGFVLR